MYKKAFTIIVIFLVAALVGAQSANEGVRAEFEAAGYEVVSSRTEAGLPVYDVRSADGLSFSVSMIGSLREARVRAVDTLTEIVARMEGLGPESVRIIFDANRATAIVIPDRFTINGRSYVRYMPSGMQFSFDEAPAYDFRLLVDNLAVRINGAFLSHEQFLDRIVRAVDNPAAYIQSSDPQYLAQQIIELRDLIDRVAADLARQSAESRRRDETMETGIRTTMEEQYDALTEALADAKRQGTLLANRIVRRGEAAVKEIGENIDGVQQEMNEKFAEVGEEYRLLTDQFIRLRRGSVVLASRNIFGTLKDVAPETISRVVELKTESPDLPADAVLEQVNGELGEEALPLHKKHVQAIYALFFNDYQ